MKSLRLRKIQGLEHGDWFSSWLRAVGLVFKLVDLKLRLGQLKRLSSRLDELKAWSMRWDCKAGLELQALFSRKNAHYQ